MLCRYAQYRNCDTASDFDLSSYTDAGEISDYALDAVEWNVENGIISGRGESELDPQDEITRAESAAIIVRASAVINQ